MRIISATSSVTFALVFLCLFALVQSDCLKGTKCDGAENCDRTACMACGSGKYQEIDGFAGNTCKYCLAGTFYVDKGIACKTCPGGRYQSSNTASIGCQDWTTCGSGQKVSVLPSLSVNRACAVCDNGMYQNTNNYVGTECNYCPAGRTWQNQDTCQHCANGKYQLENELETSGFCKQCVKGKTWQTTSTACDICAAGTYQNSNSPGNAFCKDCPTGRYLIDASNDATKHEAEADCLFCAAGTSPTTKTELCVSILI